MGCDAAQGWAIAPVMMADEALNWLRTREVRADRDIPQQAGRLRLV